MRALSQAQANRCEQALEPKCVCRCRGAAHGARRAQPSADGATGAEPMIPLNFFQELPKDDPHHLPTEQEKRERRTQRDAYAQLALALEQTLSSSELDLLLESHTNVIQALAVIQAAAASNASACATCDGVLRDATWALARLKEAQWILAGRPED